MLLYNELRRYHGKVWEFCHHLVDKGLYPTTKCAYEVVRRKVTEDKVINDLYKEWKPGRLRTRDMEKHNNKLKEVFETIRVHTVKAECTSIVEVLEEALKEVTLAIKNKDLGRLPEVKRLIEEALYGSKSN